MKNAHFFGYGCTGEEGKERDKQEVEERKRQEKESEKENGFKE